LAAGPVWTGFENLATTGIRSPDRPARSESLYRLCYHGPQRNLTQRQLFTYGEENKNAIKIVEIMLVIFIIKEISLEAPHSRQRNPRISGSIF
jgi:hypothetical protein